MLLPLFVTLGLGGCSDPGSERRLQELAEGFRVANRADSPEPMLALYALDETDRATVNLLRIAVSFELGLPIESITFEALSGAPEEDIDFVHQGVRYGPSIEPRYRMRVRYAVEESFSSLFTIGQLKDGSWRIVSTKPIPEN